uniref:Uncharacterized protein n=1 Tax=Crocodylus porosus TaxID=8502 RepID=A0A7M4ETF7_CROPO
RTKTVIELAQASELLHLSHTSFFFLSTSPAGSYAVGYAMYYFTYDPWIGKLLYLEDFYIMETYRGKNHNSLIQNPSIEYYVRRGASDLSTEEGWHLFKFDKETLLRMATE